MFKTKIVITKKKDSFDFKFSDSSNQSNSYLNNFVNTHRKL